MNDVSVDTELKICTSKYNKTSGIKYITYIGEETDKISAEVLILIPNNDVGNNRKKRNQRTRKANYYGVY